VRRAPAPADLARVERDLPGLLAWSDCAPGDVLDDFLANDDGASWRYAVLNVGAESRSQLVDAAERAHAALGFAFEPLPPGAGRRAPQALGSSLRGA
jgi:hypothetical protein